MHTQLKDDYKVKLAGIDVDNVLRGKIMQKEKFLSCVKSSSRSFGFCRSVNDLVTSVASIYPVDSFFSL